MKTAPVLSVLALLVGLQPGHAGESDAQFVQVSLVKLRAKPNTKAKVRKLLPIGSKVRATQHEDSIWCKVEPLDPSGPTGYTHCTFVGAKRPTIEGVQAEMGKAKKGSAEYRDLVSRLFRLSPSVHTLREAVGYGCSLSRGSKPDALYPALMNTLAGPREGHDLRPVYRTWNKNEHKGRGLKAKASYFKDRDQVFFLPGNEFLGRNRSRSGSAKGPDGKAEVRYSPSREGIPAHLLEYSKLLPGAKASLSLDPPRESNDMHDPGMNDVLGFSTIRAKFEPRPKAYFLTDDGKWTEGSLVEVVQDLVPAMGSLDSAVVASPKPLEPIAVILSPRPPPAKPAKIERWKSGSWAADIDGDGIHDLALMRPKDDCDLMVAGDCCELALPLVNIAGKWKQTVYLEDCMGT